jgi:hypothetical protein
VTYRRALGKDIEERDLGPFHEVTSGRILARCEK